jgi:hypothetical protein
VPWAYAGTLTTCWTRCGGASCSSGSCWSRRSAGTPSSSWTSEGGCCGCLVVAVVMVFNRNAIVSAGTCNLGRCMNPAHRAPLPSRYNYLGIAAPLPRELAVSMTQAPGSLVQVRVYAWSLQHGVSAWLLGGLLLGRPLLSTCMCVPHVCSGGSCSRNTAASLQLRLICWRRPRLTLCSTSRWAGGAEGGGARHIPYDRRLKWQDR